MSSKTGNIVYINKGFFTFFLLSFAAGKAHIYFLFMVFALFHETAHLFAALLLKCPVNGIKILPWGFTLYLKNISVKKGFLIFSAGPLISGITALFFFYTKNLFVAKINLMLCFINLLPAIPLDGGHIFYGIVRRLVHIKRISFVTGVSFLCCALFCPGFLWGIPIYFLIMANIKNPPTYIFIDDLVKRLEKKGKIK